MPYNIVEIPCPCGSDQHLLQCHGLTDEDAHWQERVESFIGILYNYQDEDSIRSSFLSPAYTNSAASAGRFWKSVQDLSSISIKAGGNAHIGDTLSLREKAEELRPINLIPDTVIFLPDTIELEGDGGDLIIQQGIFNASTYSYVVDEDGLAQETTIRISSLAGGSIFLNGQKVDKAIIEQEYYFGLVAMCKIFIRSFVCISWEAVRHSTA
jgi:hypothetical protein